ncbi:MAG: ABC transporter permease [Candidatus Kryptoniota bacterium]
MDTIFFVGLAALAIIKAAPLVYGALCGLLGERSGIVNIGIEGIMLLGAFMTFMGSALFQKWTGGIFSANLALIIGLVVGILSSGLVAALHALLSINYKVNQVISGTVINLFAIGVTNYFANVYIDPSHLAGVGVFPVIPIPLLSKIPILGQIFFSQQPLIYLMFILVLLLQYAIFHTPWGLRTRSVGEHPRAADTVGINVNQMRYINVIIGGMIAGLGGAIMISDSIGRFQKLMIGGRGFIALAVLIFGRWTPLGALGAALLFGFAEALGVRLQFGDVNQISALVVFIALILVLIAVYRIFQFLFKRQIEKKFISQTIIFGLIGVGLLLITKWVEFPHVVIPIEFLGLLPYILTILVLAGFAGKAVAPSALGKPYEKQ